MRRIGGTALEELDFWTERLRTHSFVYFAQEDIGGPVKIGTARNPLRRLAELQSSSSSGTSSPATEPTSRHSTAVSLMPESEASGSASAISTRSCSTQKASLHGR